MGQSIQVKFVKDSLYCLSRPYSFKSFKGCLPQILLVPLLNTSTHINILTICDFTSCKFFLKSGSALPYFFKNSFSSLVTVLLFRFNKEIFHSLCLGHSLGLILSHQKLNYFLLILCQYFVAKTEQQLSALKWKRSTMLHIRLQRKET